MSQASSFTIANAGGAAVRSALNTALGALVSHNSGATAPTETHPFMFWADTTADRLKMRNEADTAWITLPISLTAAATCPDDYTVLGHLIARSYLRMGVSGAEWQMDPAAGGAGATLKCGPRESDIINPAKGFTLNRSTGQMEIGDGTTSGAADHLKVNGGIRAMLHGMTFPDGTLKPTAGIVSRREVSYPGSASFLNTSQNGSYSQLELSISPQSAGSVFVVLANVVGACQTHGFWAVMRDDSPIDVGVSASQANAHGDLYAYDSKTPLVQSAVLLHEPATTSPVVFGIGFWTSNASYPVKLNEGYAAAGVSNELRGNTTLHVLEFGG